MTSIFIESKNRETTEALFIKTYINHILPNFKDYEIVPLNGWTNLRKINKLIENKDLNIDNIVIFDADTPKNNGGFVRRKKEIEEIKKEQNVDFDLFLFPNNSDDGDFELLLENIINPNHKNLLDCFEQYENCINSTKNQAEIKYQLPIRKAKIYSYIDAFPKSRKQKERFKQGNWFFENKMYWNLNSKYIENLEFFLKKTINL